LFIPGVADIDALVGPLLVEGIPVWVDLGK